jgi:hypothetical protein
LFSRDLFLRIVIFIRITISLQKGMHIPLKKKLEEYTKFKKKKKKKRKEKKRKKEKNPKPPLYVGLPPF